MSFATFNDEQIKRILRDFAGVKQLTVFIGAGASVQAFLPTWEELVRRLLRGAAVLSPKVELPADQIDAWIERTIEVESLLGAVAMADALLEKKQLVKEVLPSALYGKEGPCAYQPGPILIQLARLRALWGADLSLISTNYDDLLERALQIVMPGQPILPYVEPDRRPSGDAITVFHPHGFLGRDQVIEPFTLTEEDYFQTEAHLQDSSIGSKLIEQPCLFIGASLNDANLIRYLHRYATGTQPHAVIFVRQAEYLEDEPEIGAPRPAQEDTDAVRDARETATAARWRRRHVKPIFLHHYADVAYLIHELGYYRRGAPPVHSLATRTGRFIKKVEGRLMPVDDRARFRRGQRALNEVLDTALVKAVAVARREAERSEIELPADERLAMALWLVSPDGSQITDWATTDRLHWDPATVMSKGLDPDSRWVAVKTVLHGVPRSATRSIYSSRWRYIRGLPLDVKVAKGGTLPVGCLTLTSIYAEDRTMLTQVPEDVQTEFNKSLRRVIAKFLVEASGMEPAAAAQPSEAV